MTDFDAIQKFFGAFGHWIATGILAAWTFLRDNEKANAAGIKALDANVQKLLADVRSDNESQNTRITTLESAVKALPTASEFSRLSADVAATRAQLNGISDLLKRVEHQTDLIQQHLLQGKK